MKKKYYETQIPNKETEKTNFCIAIEDDSLIDFNIKKGCYLLVKAQNTIENGNLIVFSVGNNILISRVFFYENNAILTNGYNDKEPLTIKKESLLKDLKILGKVIACQFPIEL